MVKTRKIQNSKKGGRSGVVIERTDDSNVDEWFDSAHSPKESARKNEQQEESSIENKERSKTKEAKKKTVKTPKQRVRMSLTGAATEDGSEKGEDSKSAEKYATRLRKKSGSGVSFASPSDLSRVSTAPFSPGREDERKQESTKTNLEGESDTDDAFLTQDNHDEADLAGESDVIALQSAKANGEKLGLASPEVDFPPHEDEVEDDLGPPALPNDLSNDEDEDQEQALEANDGKDDVIGGLDTDHVENSGEKSDSNNDDYHDDDHDDDHEGPGFNMVHDPETPLTVREDRAKKEMEKIKEERRKQRRENNLESESEKDDEDEDEGEPDEQSKSTPKAEKSKRPKKKKKRSVVFSPKGIPIANRDYESVPIGALVEASPDENGPRRSRRARVKPLQFWRGEKLEYGAHNERGYIGKAFGDMPVVTGIKKALPTPYKKRKPVKTSNVSRKGSKKNDVTDTRGSVADEKFNSKKLRRKYKYHDGEEAYLWDDIADETADQKVVAYASNMQGSDLPISKKRKKEEGNVTGKAAQAFNIPNDDSDDYVGYIMGNLTLPPGGIKDSESVGPCAQTFTVVRCQLKAFEVAYGDPDLPDGELDAESAQRFLLGPGDMFRVPPGNSYRLENHSEHTDCLLTWTIIRPRAVPNGTT
ncbi:unnamed protein product [Pseudo-nitzschia multistriata]|uniref:Mif2/CENP-C cupin domain-containing protein n=1 Tax=Pseudo-nitzschia multistriata TaxID=183589 RepID=A0A448Z4G1_9STRA|nr:unnamed protein product [Pseudo-nitzschia multistriata]